MALHDSQSGIEALGPPPSRACALLGIVLIAQPASGALIQFGFPTIGLWALGFLLGVDLISHGPARLLYSLRFARATA